MANQKKILVIDDNIDQVDLNKLILEMEGFEVFTALSGSEALLVLSEKPKPDLILLDMQMDDMSGLEFLSLLEKEKPEILKTVPVVFLTAMDQIPKSKAVGFIRKSIDLDKFLEAVHRFVS